MRFSKIIFAGMMACAFLATASESELKLDYHGAGWLQIGRVEESFALPGANNDYNKNWMGNSGGALTIHSKFDEHWEGTLGMGTLLVHLARGARSQAHKWYPFWVSFVDEASIQGSWHPLNEEGELKLVLGSTHYGYNADAKNFGNYLLHGYVYPGAIVTGLTGPLGGFGSINGGMVSYKTERYSNDFIINSETDDKPLYDISVADIASYKVVSGFELGAGFNFYRLIPMNSKATSPGKGCDGGFLGPYAGQGQDNTCFIIEKDAAGNPLDTVLVSLAGTKAMARFRLDPKAWFSGLDGFGDNELVVYGEAALLGVSDYAVFYDKMLRRIPVMMGVGIPTGNYFNLSLEFEFYASKNSSDNLSAQNGSPIPTAGTGVNYARDDWKWSANASKVLFGHMVMMGQLANDHLRLGGNHDEATGIEAMRTLKDWYWTTKIAYFF